MVSPHFPPDSTAATHRVRLLAPHLAACGWEPTVLTVDPRDYEGRPDPMLAEAVPREVRVVRTRAWPAGLTRRVGIGDLGARAFNGLRRAANSLVRRESFDALFVTIYPALLGPILKRRTGLPFVLDYQDPWVGAWGDSVGPQRDGRPDFKSRLSRLIATRLEPIALGAADAVTAVSQATYEQALARTPGAHPLAVEELPIGWDARDFEIVRHARDAGPSFDGDVINISYVGTVWPSATATIRALLQACGRLRERGNASRPVRLHFIGTSSRRSGDPPLVVMPLAKEIGVADAVSEQPARVDYFEALQALRDSSAILLIGGIEPHYTPSKVFPVLLSERPVLAILHEHSAGAELLRRAGRPPSVRLVTFSATRPVSSCVDAIACELARIAADPHYRRQDVNLSAIEPMSAPALARRLASVLDRIARPTA
jgi:hypothetical protein